MINEDTQLHDAVTPGPVFAYRAFRNLVWGSPESSPIRQQYDNKENLPRLDLRMSPAAKRKEHDVLDFKLTPKRQRTEIVSPTKSILRNPNAPTPRRAALRNVTVAFKDVGHSISPEVVKNPSPVKAKSRAVSEGMTKSVKTSPSRFTLAPPRQQSTTTTTVSVPAAKTAQLAAVASTGSSNPDLERYKESTERETKKLMKYAQKLRDHARKRDDENEKLKALLEEARLENERLQRRLDEKKAEDVSKQEMTLRDAASHSNQKTPMSKSSQIEPATVKKTTSLNNIDFDSDSILNVVSQNPAKSNRRSYSSAIPNRPASERLKQEIVKPADTQRASSTPSAHDLLQRISSLRSKADSSIITPNLDTTEDLNNVYRRRETQQATTTESRPRPSTKTPEAMEVSKQQAANKEMRNIPIRPSPSQNKSEMPVDRAAAARERLRLRRAARQGSGQQPKEDSQLDWVGV